MESLPILDFSCLSIEKNENELDAKAVENIGQEIVEAFQNIGFVYLTNHGVQKEQVVYFWFSSCIMNIVSSLLRLCLNRKYIYNSIISQKVSLQHAS